MHMPISNTPSFNSSNQFDIFDAYQMWNEAFNARSRLLWGVNTQELHRTQKRKKTFLIGFNTFGAEYIAASGETKNISALGKCRTKKKFLISLRHHEVREIVPEYS
jgi:hypothetical protein